MRRKQLICLALALFAAITTCLYGAVFAACSSGMKICCGVSSAILYAMLNLIPYFTIKRKNGKW